MTSVSARTPLGPPHVRRSTVALLVGVGTLLALSLAAIVSLAPHPRPLASPVPFPTATTLNDVDQLSANGLLGRLGVLPFANLRDDVLAQGRYARRRDPRPGPLPESVGDLRDDGKAALALAIASVLGNDPRDTGVAADYLDAWAIGGILDPACLDAACDRAWRIARDLPAFVFAADLIRDSGAMTAQRTHRFAEWLLAMRPGQPRLADRRGDADVLARVAVSVYLDDAAGLDTAVEEWRTA